MSQRSTKRNASRLETTIVRRMATVVKSPVVGTVWKIEVAVGDTVAEDDQIMILESMKMEIPIEAEASGTITEIHVEEGAVLAEGDPLATIT